MTDKRETRRQARIDEAVLGLLTAWHLLRAFNETAARDGITLDNCAGADLPVVRKRILEEAEKIRLLEVYGELDDADAARLLEEER
jgi:hypothetical protein